MWYMWHVIVFYGGKLLQTDMIMNLQYCRARGGRAGNLCVAISVHGGKNEKAQLSNRRELATYGCCK